MATCADLPDLDPLGPGDPSVLIGIVDGAPDLSVPGLADADIVLEQTMRIAEAHGPDPHGTEVCSLLFDRGRGLAAGCRGLVLPVFFPDPRPSHMAPRATQTDIARALTMAVERGAAIVNVSAGQLSATPEASRHLEDALKLCERQGVLVIAAAGNDGCDCLHVPAAVASVLAVGAMDSAGTPLGSSNFGASYAANGILAPGAAIEVSTLGGERVRRSGSSFATAAVSGIAARMLSAAIRSGCGLGALDMRRILIETARPCDPAADGECARILAGRLDLPAAIERLRQFLQPEPEAAFLRLSEDDNRGREPMIREQILVRPAAATLPPQGQAAAATGIVQSDCGCGCGGKKKARQQDSAADDMPAEDMLAGAINEAADFADGKAEVGLNGMAQAAQPARSGARNGSPLAPATATQSGVTQQACSCSGGSKEPQKVYALGSVWFDFGSEPRYDAIVQWIGDPVSANTPATLIDKLSGDLSFATGITFILMQDQIPIYAITPAGPFAQEVYRDLLDAMKTSLGNTGDLQRVAVPGYVHGSTRLMNGMVLPVVYPDPRGLAKWEPDQLVAAAKSAIGAEDMDNGPVFNFLIRVYDEMRNLGINPAERAMNFAATNAFQGASVFADGLNRGLELYGINVAKSPICRPDSDCWDVQVTMFDAENERRAGRVYRFTVDVSEVLPVTVGTARSWSVPLSAMSLQASLPPANLSPRMV